MTIHATAITIHGCKVHLEPTGPEPSDAEQRLRHEVSVVSSADNCLRGILSGMVAVAKPPRRCQRCDSIVEGGAFVIVGGGVMHHECFREAMTTAKATSDDADRLRAEVRRLTDERAKAIAERDEARQMHKERVFYDRTHLEQENIRLGAQLNQARIQLQDIAKACGEIPECTPAKALAVKISGMAKL